MTYVTDADIEREFRDEAAEEMMRCLEQYVSYGSVPLLPAPALQDRSLAALRAYYVSRALKQAPTGYPADLTSDEWAERSNNGP